MGRRIKAIRKMLGKSQEEFGQLFDPPAPKSSVSYWENGGGPNKKRLKKIADLGGVTPAYLINGSQLSVANLKKLAEKIKKEDQLYILSIKMPFVDKRELKLLQNGDEISIAIKNEKRNITVPKKLEGREITGARYEKGKLNIIFH